MLGHFITTNAVAVLGLRDLPTCLWNGGTKDVYYHIWHAITLNKTSVKQARPSGGGLKSQLFETLGQGIFKFNAFPGYRASLNPAYATQQGSSKTRVTRGLGMQLTRAAHVPHSRVLGLVLSTKRKAEKGRQK